MRSRWLHIVFAIITLIPNMALSNSDSHCVTDLFLLDATLISVLDQTALLINSFQTVDPESASSSTLKAEIERTLERLLKTINDEPTRQAMRLYLKEKTGHVTDHVAELARTGELQARDEERQRFTPYTLSTTLRYIIDRHSDFFDDGRYVQFIDPRKYVNEPIRLSVKNVFTHTEATIPLSQDIDNFEAIRYFPDQNRALILSTNGLYSVRIPTLMAPNTKAEITPLFTLQDDSPSNQRKAFDLIFTKQNRPTRNDSNDSVESRPWEILKSPRFSKDGSIVAFMQDHSLVVYDLKSQKFQLMKKPKFKIWEPNFGSESWALSPDGKYIAASVLPADENYPDGNDNILLYDTATGEIINGFPSRTRTLTFSGDGAWLLSNDGEHNLIMRNILNPGLETDRHYKVRGDKHLGGIMRGLFITPDGLNILAQSSGGSVEVVNVQDGGIVQEIKGISGRIVFVKDSGAFIDLGNEVHLYERK